MLTKEEYREKFKLIKKDTGNHKVHYVIISTKTLSEIEDENRHDIILKEGEMKQRGGKKIKITNMGEQTSHDMTKIAIIKKNIIPMLRMKQAKKGKISPVGKDNKELTVLFKEGIYGNKQEALENIARCAKKLGTGNEMK